MSLNDVDFTGKMQHGRDLAALRRHRDTAPSRPKFAKRQPAEDTPENRLYAELANLRSELRERDNTIAVLQNGGGGLEPIDPWASPKREGPGLQAEPHVIMPRTRSTEVKQGNTMTTEQYLRALKKLDLTPASKQTAAYLGLSIRQCLRLSSGEQLVPLPVAKLLRMYLDHGLPEQS